MVGRRNEKMEKKIYVMVLLALLMVSMTGCITVPTQPQPTTTKEQITTEANQQTLVSAQPLPTISKSLERENLIKRIKLLNDESKVFYVYLINYGKVMAFYTAQGKVSSLNAYLTGKEQIVRNPYRSYTSEYGENYFLMESPDLDGTYGQNTDGIFFFTTEGAYVEYRGDYMVSDFPLKLSTPPELVKNVS
jgi:hypothetical protein